MISYEKLAATFQQTLERFGSTLSVRGVPTPSDPVDGSGGAVGTLREVTGALTDVDFSVFPETRVRSGDQQIVFAAEVRVGEAWVRGTNDEITIAEVEVVKPNNTDALAYIALARS